LVKQELYAAMARFIDRQQLVTQAMRDLGLEDEMIEEGTVVEHRTLMGLKYVLARRS
jgi:hypothetical protein